MKPLKPDPLVNLPVKLRREIEQWAARQPDSPSLSEAVTRLVEKALEIERKLDEQNAHAEIVHLLLRMRDHIAADDVEFLERRAAGYLIANNVPFLTSDLLRMQRIAKQLPGTKQAEFMRSLQATIGDRGRT